MTFKNIRFHGLYAILLIIFLFTILIFDIKLKNYGNTTFQIWPQILFGSIAYPLVGGMIGLFHLLKERKKAGRWRVDGGKLLVLGLPIFCLAYFMFFVFSVPFDVSFLPVNIQIALASEPGFTIFQILLGFTIVTSFYKE